MSAVPIKKVTINLPERLLARVQGITGLGITATLIEALKEIEKRDKRSALKKLRGKIAFDLDLELTRQ